MYVWVWVSYYFAWTFGKNDDILEIDDVISCQVLLCHCERFKFSEGLLLTYLPPPHLRLSLSAVSCGLWSQQVFGFQSKSDKGPRRLCSAVHYLYSPDTLGLTAERIGPVSIYKPGKRRVNI